MGRARVAACLSIADVGCAIALGSSRRSRFATTDMGIAAGSLNARADLGLPGAGISSSWAGSIMGRPTAIGLAAGRRALQTRSTRGAVMEPARSGMGGAKARGLGTWRARRARIGRLGSTPARGWGASTHGRTIVGGACGRCSRQVGVAVMERAGRAGLGYAQTPGASRASRAGLVFARNSTG